MTWAIAMAASALGPYTLALGAELAGGFAVPSAVLAAIPLCILIAAFTIRPPRRRSTV